jgi:hypothetical protein
MRVNPNIRAIYGADSSNILQQITSTTDGSKHRLDVEAKGSINTLPTFGDPIYDFYNQVLVSVPATLCSHTVNTGKLFYIYGWGCSSEAAKFWLELRVDGTPIDGMINANTGTGQRGVNSVNYTAPVFEATAGEVVTVYARSESDNNKHFMVFLYGIEVDA